MIRLGLDLGTGEIPLVTVPRDSGQAAELATGEPFAFGTNVCAPRFDYSRLEIGGKAALLSRFLSMRRASNA